MARRRGFVREAEIEEGIALVQLSPGPIMVDLVAFIGYRRRGVPGALCAAAGFILPATVLMLVLATAYRQYGDLPAVAALLPGLIAFVVGVVVHVTLDMGRKNLAGPRDGVLALLAFAIGATGGNMLWAVAGGIIFGALGWRTASDKVVAPAAEPLSWRRLALPLLCGGALVGAALAWVAHPGALSDIGLTFMKIGSIAFGNAATILPIMQQAVVDEHRWLTGPEFAAAIAFGQITPGPMLNSATFVGYYVAGLPGAVLATAAIFSPSIVMKMVSTEIFVHVRHLAPVRAAIRGVMAAFVGMLAWVVVSLAGYMADRPVAWVLVAVTLFTVRFLKWDMLKVLGASLLLWTAMLTAGLA